MSSFQTFKGVYAEKRTENGKRRTRKDRVKTDIVNDEGYPDEKQNRNLAR
jgi:hypothetical protein